MRQDKDSVIADPLFVSAGNFEFRPRQDGFQQIDMSTMGPRVPSGQ